MGIYSFRDQKREKPVVEPPVIEEEIEEEPASGIYDFKKPQTVTDYTLPEKDNYFLYDGDTIIDSATNKRYRLPGVNTGELSRIGKDFGELSLNSYAGPAQKEAVNKIIQEKKFNELRYAEGFERKDKYGRYLMDLFNEQGESLSNYLHQERVVDNYMFASKEQEALRFLGEFHDSIKADTADMTVGDKAREMVEAIVAPSPSMKKVFGTSDEVFLGSSMQVKFIQAEINKLRAQLKKTKDPEEKKSIEDSISYNRLQLSYAVNIPPKALSVSVDKYRQQKGDVGYWAESLNSAEKSFYMLSNTAGGFSAWAGDALDAEGLQEWGDDWAVETEQDIYDAGYTTGFWDVRNPYDALKFMSNTIIQYAPQLAILKASAIAGGMAAGPVGAIGGALGAGFVLAVSSVYQGQPEGEKDPLKAGLIAMPIALLDRWGISRALPEGEAVKFFTREGQENFKKLLVEKGISKSAKEANELIKKDMVEILKESSDYLRDEAFAKVLAKKNFQDIIREVAKTGGMEAATEALQQAVEEIGLDLTTSLDVDYEQLVYNMIEAGASGAVVGGAFQLPSTLRKFDNYNTNVWLSMPENEAMRSQESIWTEEHMKKHGKKLSIMEAGAEYRARSMASGGQTLSSLEDKAEADSSWKELMYATSNPKRFLQSARGFGSKWYKNARTDKSNHHMQAFGNLQGHLNNLYTGSTFQSEHRILESTWAKEMLSRDNLSRNIGIKENELFKYLALKDDQIEASNLTETQKRGILTAKDNLKRLTKIMQAEVIKRNTSILDALTSRVTKLYGGGTRAAPGGKRKEILQLDLNVPLWEEGQLLLKPSSFEPSSIDNNFKTLLMKSKFKENTPYFNRLTKEQKEKLTTMSESDADSIIEEIYNDTLSLDSRAILESRGVFDDSKFLKYFNPSVYDNAMALLNTVAKEVIIQTRFGKNGEITAQILNEAHAAKEITEQEKYQIAAVAADVMRMNRGNYRPIKNDTVKKLQDHALFFGTITFMDSNFWANMVEIANSTLGLGPKQFFNYIRNTGSVFAKQVYNDVFVRVPAAAGLRKNKTKRELADEDLRFQRLVQAGLLAPKGGISYYEGVNSTSPFYKKLLNHFWQWNMVENQTNAIRAGRAGAAWENITKMVQIIEDHESRPRNTPDEKDSIQYDTAATRWAKDNLDYYGLDQTRLRYLFNKVTSVPTEEDIINGRTDRLTPAEAIELRDAYRTGVARFTDEITVRPEPGSTPRIIEDPHFALFTHFKRFITHFTANVIPRMYNNYLRSGKPGMTYSVFSTIAGAYLLAFLSMMIKDMIVYNGTPDWLEDDEEDPYWLRTSYSRAADYTGWLGTPMMAVKFIGDYNNAASYKSPLENLFESIIGEAPVPGALYSDLIGSNRTLSESAAKRMPFLGDISYTREKMAEYFKSIGN